jgi:hypothetical protein
MLSGITATIGTGELRKPGSKIDPVAGSAETRCRLWLLGRVRTPRVGAALSASNRLRRRSQCVVREIEATSCPAGPCRSLLSEAWPLIRCFKMTDGWKTTILRGEIGSLAVFALRPMRRAFLRFFFRALFPCRPESPILT